MEIRKVIPSRSRWDSISTHNLLQDFTLVVPESEKEKYQHIQDPVTIPDEIKGLGAVRNWILNHFQEECIIMFDDDIRIVENLQNYSPLTITDPEQIEWIIQNTAWNAYEAGAHIFGWSQKGDVRKYRPDRPFSFTNWVGTAIGVIGREYSFIENNKLKVDADICLQALLKDRFIWNDERYYFRNMKDGNTGGNSFWRNEETVLKEIEYLKKKWGKWIKIGQVKSKRSLSLTVKRQQSIKL
jgi:glycosyltransferase involved in cell wall biosynthesis